MKLQILGHASLLIRNEKDEPVLLTDPWLIGSCYWRSWWIQNYPDDRQMEILKRVKHCYITHEHPDHYHIPSLRKLGNAPHYLAPDVPNCQISTYVQDVMKYKIDTVPAFTWFQIDTNVHIYSLPTYSEDSSMIISTPHAIILNLNDTKPSSFQLDDIKAFLTTHRGNKKVIVLSSYSPASPVNNFFRNHERVNIRTKIDYIKRINGLCDFLQADFFMPFASQVIFHRSDTTWANEFKVKYSDLKDGWNSSTTLLPPYSTLDLNTFSNEFVNEANYNHTPEVYKAKVAEEEMRDRSIVLTDEHLKKLQRKFNRIRLVLMFIFPRGFGIKTGEHKLTYKPWKGKIIRGMTEGHFTMSIPTHALIESLGDHIYFGDLIISMFIMIELDKRTDPRFVYAMFMIIEVEDHFHFKSIRNFFNWIIANFRVTRWKVSAPPL